MAVLTSRLILELIDRITAPSRTIAASLNKITAMQKSNAAMMAATSQKLLVTAAAAYGLAKGLQAPVQAAAAFETSLLNIGQKADMSDESIAAMGKRIRALGPIVNQSALEVAKGVDALVGFGLDTDRAETLMGPIGKAATAYQAQVEDLAKAGFSVIDNLKLKADDFGKALDVMAQSGKEGAFEIKDMAAQFPSLTASAQALGMTGVTAVGRLSAALQIARKGASDGSEAATNTANLMQKIISPETTKKFKELGVDVRKELKKTQKSGGDVFEMIARLTDKALKGDLSKIGDLFQDAQVQKFLRPLMQNMDEYRKIRDKALAATGVVDKDFARRMMTNAAQTEAFKIQLNNLSMTIGNILLPSVNKIMAAITPVIQSFERFAEANPKLVTGIVAVAGSLLALRIAGLLAKFALGWMAGAALVTAAAGLKTLAIAVRICAFAMLPFGAALRAARTAMIGFAAVTAILGTGGALKAAGAAMLAFLGPIGLIAAAVAAAGVAIYAYWDDIKGAIGKVNDALTELTGINLFEAGKSILSSLWEGMKSMFSSMLGWVAAIPGAIKGAIGMGGGNSRAAGGAGNAAGGSPAVAGARAAGGPVRAGAAYLVGENGPELFLAPASGAISSTADTVRMLKESALAGASGQGGRGGGGGNTFNVTNNIQAAPGQSTEAIAAAVERKFSEKLAQLSRGAYSDGVN